MRIELEDHDTESFSAKLGMKENEIGKFIETLKELRAKQFEHFVIVNKSDDGKSGGLENIEFYLYPEKDQSKGKTGPHWHNIK